MNLPKLKGVIREKKKNYAQCASAIDKSMMLSVDRGSQEMDTMRAVLL